MNLLHLEGFCDDFPKSLNGNTGNLYQTVKYSRHFSLATLLAVRLFSDLFLKCFKKLYFEYCKCLVTHQYSLIHR